MNTILWSPFIGNCPRKCAIISVCRENISDIGGCLAVSGQPHHNAGPGFGRENFVLYPRWLKEILGTYAPGLWSAPGCRRRATTILRV